MLGTHPAWRNLKRVDDYRTGLHRHNRWGMIYRRPNGDWHCMACTADFDRGGGRSHYCPWERRWRTWTGRQSPVVDIETRADTAPRGLLGRMLSLFRG